MSQLMYTRSGATGAPPVLSHDKTLHVQPGGKEYPSLASPLRGMLSTIINLPSRLVARLTYPLQRVWQWRVCRRSPLAARQWHPARAYSRRGASILEVLVACTLLGTVLSIATPLVVRHNRLLTAHREYQMALDELSNQIERLAALPAAELPSALEQLSPSELTASHLHSAKLSGELTDADQGQRLTLHLVWDEPQRKSAPVSLATWIYRREASP